MRLRIFAVLLLAQAVGRTLTVLIILGTVGFGGRFLFEVLLVAVVQTLAILGLQKLVRLAFRQPGPEEPLPFALAWPTLAAMYVACMVGYDLLAYNHLDLTFAAYAQAVAVPLLEAIALAAVAVKSWRSWPRAMMAVVSRQPFLIAVTAADIGVLWLALGRRDPDGPAAVPADSLPVYYLGIKGLSAGLLTLLRASRDRGRPAERMWTALLGIGLAGYGWDQVFGWMARWPGALFPDHPLLFQWIVFYGPLFLLVVLVLEQASRVWMKSQVGAAIWLRASLALLLLGALIVAIDVYNRPFLPLFWARLAWTSGFLSISALWIAVWDYSDVSRPTFAQEERAEGRSL